MEQNESNNSERRAVELSDPEAWERAVEAANPASLLVVIRSRMSDWLKSKLGPEDILQESLLHAWRGRSDVEWRGHKAFRSWLLTIIDHRIRDAAEHHSTAKRGGDKVTVPIASMARSDISGASGDDLPLPRSTTPSRIAIYKEQATAIEDALQSLPDDFAIVVRMRIIEQRTIREIAELTGLTVDMVRSRVRRGSELYLDRVRALFASRR